VGTFGDAERNLRTILDTGKIIALRVHLSNGPCERNGNCERGEIASNQFGRLERRAKQFNAIISHYPRIKTFISPRLEHDCRDPRTVNKWVEICKNASPQSQLVISAYKGIYPVGVPVLSEGHGNDSRADVVSNDGESLYNAPINWAKQGRVLALGWIPECNGKVSLHQAWVPPSKRKVN
jgi:hypothetical protein